MRFLHGGSQVSIEYFYPVSIGRNDYSLDWNRVFANLPFFIPSRFITVNPRLMRVDGLSCNVPTSYRVLPEMQDRINIYVFAPWLHPEPVTKAADKLHSYCFNGEFPGCVGLTLDTSSRPILSRS